MLMVTHDINNEERNKTSVQENNTSLFDKELQILEMKWVNSVQTDYKRINYKTMRQYCIRLKWNTDMGYDSAVNAADGVGEKMIIRKSNNNAYKLYAALLEDEKKRSLSKIAISPSEIISDLSVNCNSSAFVGSRGEQLLLNHYDQELSFTLNDL